MNPPATDGDLVAHLGLDRARLTGLIGSLARDGRTLATAESLTGGLLGAVLTAIPGASAVVRGGLICYATDVKASLAGVDMTVLIERGPVDREVAAQLADGARRVCGADIGVGLTGAAGPDPQDGVAPGTVYIAVAQAATRRVEALAGTTSYPGRDAIRAAAVRHALDMIAHLALK